jgi:hypothetical protein
MVLAKRRRFASKRSVRLGWARYDNAIFAIDVFIGIESVERVNDGLRV